MNDLELNDVIRTCGGPYDKSSMTAAFIPSNDLVVRWTRSSDFKGKEFLNLRFSEPFRLAPASVIREITKKVIQQVCYSSDYELSEETLDWIADLRNLINKKVS